jgi:hypothetical protein
MEIYRAMSMPNEPSETQLKKVGVTILRRRVFTLKCCRCSKEWAVKERGLRLPKGYWKCPNGCNAVKDAGSACC